MFCQVIEGKVADAELLLEQHHRWIAEIKPKTAGYLGLTGGITADGTFVLSLRFEDKAGLEKLAALPEQEALFADMAPAFDGQPTSVGSDDVVIPMEGSDAAGFVQMMQAKVSDRARWEQLEEEMTPGFLEMRPDVLGHMAIWLPGSVVHVVDWFSSEAEARAGEQKDYPEELKQRFGEWMGLMSDVRWFDITEPLLDSA